jgi:hemerythrin-like metal-binding protein
MQTFTQHPEFVWTDALALHDPRTDRTHQEFIDLCQLTARSEGAQQLEHYRQLLVHTEGHFTQEERWMLATGLNTNHCHFIEHKSVLEVMLEVERRAELGDMHLIATMLQALVEWFPTHATSMDAGLIALLQTTGFDTETETFKGPVPTIEHA